MHAQRSNFVKRTSLLPWQGVKLVGHLLCRILNGGVWGEVRSNTILKKREKRRYGKLTTTFMSKITNFGWHANPAHITHTHSHTTHHTPTHTPHTTHHTTTHTPHSHTHTTHTHTTHTHTPHTHTTHTPHTHTTHTHTPHTNITHHTHTHTHTTPHTHNLSSCY
jgi:hypothetical protein